MEKKYTTTYNGVKFDVVEARADSQMDVQISVMGDKAFTKKAFTDYHDVELESQGYYRLAVVNGSLFFSEGTSSYANGIEKAFGVVHENDDAAWDDNMGFYHNHGVPYMYPQRYIKTIINREDVRGAKTAAFGLVNNGLIDVRGARQYTNAYGRVITEPSRKIYLAKSGRTIVGKRKDGTIVLAACDGVTGVSGLTGYQTAVFARGVLKLSDAVCEDGGGSTFLQYKDIILNGSDREGVNAVAIYVKLLNPLAVGDTVIINGMFTIEQIIGDKAILKELAAAIYFNKLQKVG